MDGRSSPLPHSGPDDLGTCNDQPAIVAAGVSRFGQAQLEDCPGSCTTRNDELHHRPALRSYGRCDRLLHSHGALGDSPSGLVCAWNRRLAKNQQALSRPVLSIIMASALAGVIVLIGQDLLPPLGRLLVGVTVLLVSYVGILFRAMGQAEFYMGIVRGANKPSMPDRVG